jgi:hypothetical protein
MTSKDPTSPTTTTSSTVPAPIKVDVAQRKTELLNAMKKLFPEDKDTLSIADTVKLADYQYIGPGEYGLPKEPAAIVRLCSTGQTVGDGVISVYDRMWWPWQADAKAATVTFCTVARIVVKTESKLLRKYRLDAAAHSKQIHEVSTALKNNTVEIEKALATVSDNKAELADVGALFVEHKKLTAAIEKLNNQIPAPPPQTTWYQQLNIDQVFTVPVGVNIIGGILYEILIVNKPTISLTTMCG